MFEPRKRLALAVGSSLTAGIMVMFWSLHLALSRLQAYA
jgi:hypothetical protein